MMTLENSPPSSATHTQFLSRLTLNYFTQAMHKMHTAGLSYADIYAQQKHVESWSLDEGVVKEGHYSAHQGAGLRTVNGEKTAFSYTNSFAKKDLLTAAQTCASMHNQGQDYHSNGHNRAHNNAPQIITPPSQIYLPNLPDKNWDAAQKVQWLRDIEQLAKSLDNRIVQVNASLSMSHEDIVIYTINHQVHTDSRPLVRCNITVIAEQGKHREIGTYGAGGRFSLDGFLTPENMKTWVTEAVRIACLNLDAKPAPAGNFPVVLGNGWPGVLLHEAVGHGLEADFNRKGSSVFSGRIGEKVASDLCTIVDNGTLANRRGSLNIDDEGTPTQNTVLIENGILKNYMQDTQNAQLMNSTLTGNARRESYAYLPMPRMTNTYMLAGKSEPDAIIASIKKGLYAVNFNGGQVDITSGQFTFSTSEAYWVENGRIQYPVKNATLIGNGPEVMQKISMVGNDLALDNGIGVCGKAGQSVPVGVGQPTLKIDEIVIGGTN